MNKSLFVSFIISFKNEVQISYGSGVFYIKDFNYKTPEGIQRLVDFILQKLKDEILLNEKEINEKEIKKIETIIPLNITELEDLF